MRTDKLQIARSLAALSALSVVFVLAFYQLVPLPHPLFEDDYSTIVTDRRGQLLRVYLNEEEQWILPPDPSLPIPKRLRETVLAFEDRYFFHHPGVNPGAILRALYQNLTSGRRVSGASTITMQVARLIRPKPRTIRSKILEALQALAVEMRYSKEEILRLYLNHAPYGGNIRGYRAASLKYFAKSATELTWAEAATLAVLPNAPRLSPDVAGPDALEDRRNELLKRLREFGIIDRHAAGLATEEEVPRAARPLPVWAPHLCDYARSLEDSDRIATTIDLELQKRLESMVEFHSAYLASTGVDNVSALVANTVTGEAVAYAGSADYFDYSVQGHIDGIQSPRSTGSILKPLLYALAMDEGMLIPHSLLQDIPTQIGAYAPRNIDRRYRGLVSAEEALVRSLNVPAVRLLNAYGLEPFYFFLKDAGLDHIFRRPEDYGLPLILGGAEATPWEIAGLYRGLATEGSFAPLSVIPGGETSPVQLISPGAAYLTLEMLRQVQRPGAEAYWRAFEGGVPVAWKTGTSYGRRDAWAVGVTPTWTVVVWTGNFRGEGNANLSSTTSAGYLLFEILNSFPRRDEPAWFTADINSLRDTEVCVDTGYRATESCRHRSTLQTPAAAPPLAPCPYHKTIYVTADERYRVDSRCWDRGNYHRRSVLVFPPEVAQHTRAGGIELSVIPPWSPDCVGSRDASRVTIVYPTEGARIFLPRELDGSLQKLTLRAAHQDGNAALYWYLGSRYLGRTRDVHKLSVELDRGEHTVTCVDEHGARVAVRFYVDVE